VRVKENTVEEAAGGLAEPVAGVHKYEFGTHETVKARF
jgi:hypothetical protein